MANTISNAQGDVCYYLIVSYEPEEQWMCWHKTKKKAEKLHFLLKYE